MSNLQRPIPRPGVLAIEPYVPGKSTAPGVAKVYKLSSNETPLGPSPKAIAAYQSVAAHLEDYPDGAATRLREAIGCAFGLDPARIVCGAGSDDLLNLLARAYLADGDEAIHTTHGFLVYPIATLGSGAKPIVAAEKSYTADVDTILAAVSERTKVVFLANPNNPTGTYASKAEIARLHAGLPGHVLLVLDHAYAAVRAAVEAAEVRFVSPFSGGEGAEIQTFNDCMKAGAALESADHASVVALLARAAAIGLSGLQTDMLVKAVHKATDIGIKTLRKALADRGRST